MVMENLLIISNFSLFPLRIKLKTLGPLVTEGFNKLPTNSVYNHTCVQRPPMGSEQSGPSSQVVFNCRVIYIGN